MTERPAPALKNYLVVCQAAWYRPVAPLRPHRLTLRGMTRSRLPPMAPAAIPRSDTRNQSLGKWVRRVVAHVPMSAQAGRSIGRLAAILFT